MIDAAAAAGADCVKFQCHITEAEMIPTDMKPGKISEERLWDIIKRCELTEDEEKRVKAYCEEKGVIYLCTPFSREAADRLEAMNVEAYKIGSGECNNLPLLEHIAQKGKPIILSTGMNDIQSIRRSVSVIQKYDLPLILMHCTSMYPTPYERVRLGAITELLEEFGLPVGLSDHSLGIYTCLGAVALGACVLEKHFTVTRSWPGPDVPISIEPHELAELVKGSRAVFVARGGSKTILDEEKPVIDFAYASVVSIRPIRKGEPLTTENVWVKRPGGGDIPAALLDQVLGKKATRDIPADRQLKTDDVDGFEPL
ncbi:MAG: N-acetylneuraminate synthase family protein [Deltaproteobacteria bacterium]|nr:N-acetylneuraminate synthase family protein [Deltaproteobacteria bacterium]MBW2008858.1 N-acetylneuraminate synthase family protein [Deltaproteobacteria bacterium]RLB32536.1 MAG: polyhydroxyalkanoate biosynthesis repressor PhaR [Deltaproteobacteria bacterium]